jgi:hypothetical protein
MIKQLVNMSIDFIKFKNNVKSLKKLISEYETIWIDSRKPYEVTTGRFSYDCDERKEEYCDTRSSYGVSSYTVCILCLILFISVIVMLCQKQK